MSKKFFIISLIILFFVFYYKWEQSNYKREGMIAPPVKLKYLDKNQGGPSFQE